MTIKTKRPNQAEEDIIELKDIVEKGRYYASQRESSSWTSKDDLEELDLDKELNKLFINPNYEHKTNKVSKTNIAFDDTDIELDNLFYHTSHQEQLSRENITQTSNFSKESQLNHTILGKQDTENTQLSEIHSKIEILTAKVKQLEENQTKLLQSEDFESRIKEIFNKYIKDLTQWHDILNKIIEKEIEGLWSKIENKFYEFQEQIITREELQNFAAKIRKEVAEQINEKVPKATAQIIKEEIVALMDNEQKK